MSSLSSNAFSIRSFRAGDQDACQTLYREGLIGGTLVDNDTALDLVDIDATYMRQAGNHFWVAEIPEEKIVGMIGVQHYDEGAGEIRRLRVACTHRRRGIGSALVEAALHFCQDKQYLKITLDTYMEREPAVRLFEKYHFRHHRTRNVGGHDLMYFYFDLYSGEKKSPE